MLVGLCPVLGLALLTRRFRAEGIPLTPLFDYTEDGLPLRDVSAWRRAPCKEAFVPMMQKLLAYLDENYTVQPEIKRVILDLCRAHEEKQSI